MRDKDLYAQILGIQHPWMVRSVFNRLERLSGQRNAANESDLLIRNCTVDDGATRGSAVLWLP